jgi:hypothetical protein
MQTSTTRAIENIVKSFKGFQKPTSEAIRAIAEHQIRRFPITAIHDGPTRKNGKFCKPTWILKFPWKPSEEPSTFHSLEAALAASDAYHAQNIKAIACRNMLLMDQLKGEAEATLWREYTEKVGVQGNAVARLAKSDALKDLSRM